MVNRLREEAAGYWVDALAHWSVWPVIVAVSSAFVATAGAVMDAFVA